MEYKIIEDRVFFKIKYNKETIDFFKSIPNYWWHSEEKEWSFPVENKDKIIEYLLKSTFATASITRPNKTKTYDSVGAIKSSIPPSSKCDKLYINRC